MNWRNASKKQVRFVRCDVTQPLQIKSAIEAAVRHFGGLDILVSNAGAVGRSADVEDWDADGWGQTQALLLRSVVAGASYATPHMRKRGGGSIINTSSISGLQAGYAPMSYSVAKAAVLHFTRVAATELSAHRIRINAVVPGFIATSIFGSALGMSLSDAKKLGQAVAERSASANPIGRSGMPGDIANAALVFGQRRIKFCHGHAYHGGWRSDHRPAPQLGH